MAEMTVADAVKLLNDFINDDDLPSRNEFMQISALLESQQQTIAIMEQVQKNVTEQSIEKITQRLCGFQADPYSVSFRNEIAHVVNEMIRR